MKMCGYAMMFFVYKQAESDLADIDPNDPFALKDKAEHDKLLAIGRAFEAKYVSMPTAYCFS